MNLFDFIVAIMLFVLPPVLTALGAYHLVKRNGVAGFVSAVVALAVNVATCWWFLFWQTDRYLYSRPDSLGYMQAGFLFGMYCAMALEMGCALVIDADGSLARWLWGKVARRNDEQQT